MRYQSPFMVPNAYKFITDSINPLSPLNRHYIPVAYKFCHKFRIRELLMFIHFFIQITNEFINTMDHFDSI